MKSARTRLALSLAVTALLGAFALFVTPAPAEAQCLAQSECDALRAQLEAARAEGMATREQMRSLREQIRALPEGSAERQALREQARELRRANKERRRALKPVAMQYRQGCRNC